MFIKNEKVTLTPMDQRAWESLMVAHLEPEFDLLTSDDTMPKSMQDIGLIYSKFNYPHGRLFQICPSSGDLRGIGTVGLCNINLKNRNSEIHIGIWEKSKRVGGYGMEAGKLMMKYAFDDLALHRLYAIVIQGNDLLINSAESIGFKVEAVLKGCFFVEGKYKNGILIAAINPTR